MNKAFEGKERPKRIDDILKEAHDLDPILEENND